jgi:hypothetical protein
MALVRTARRAGLAYSGRVVGSELHPRDTTSSAQTAELENCPSASAASARVALVLSPSTHAPAGCLQRDSELCTAVCWGQGLRHACTQRANAPPSALREANEQHQQPSARAEDRRIAAAEVGSLTGARSRLECPVLMLTWPADRQTEWIQVEHNICCSPEEHQESKAKQGQHGDAHQRLASTLSGCQRQHRSSGCLVAVASLRYFLVRHKSSRLTIRPHNNLNITCTKTARGTIFVSPMPLPRLALAALRGVSIGAMSHRTTLQ